MRGQGPLCVYLAKPCVLSKAVTCIYMQVCASIFIFILYIWMHFCVCIHIWCTLYVCVQYLTVCSTIWVYINILEFVYFCIFGCACTGYFCLLHVHAYCVWVCVKVWCGWMLILLEAAVWQNKAQLRCPRGHVELELTARWKSLPQSSVLSRTYSLGWVWGTGGTKHGCGPITRLVNFLLQSPSTLTFDLSEDKKTESLPPWLWYNKSTISMSLLYLIATTNLRKADKRHNTFHYTMNKNVKFPTSFLFSHNTHTVYSGNGSSS